MKTLILCALSLTPALASATTISGYGTRGGGNAVCNSATNECKMVEQYQVSVSEIKGYAIYAERLANLRTLLPGLADRIEQGAARKTWYLVPADFDQLSVDQTKLYFDTNQAAYQDDFEIFVSLNSLNRMDDQAAAFKLMHESIMATQEVRDAPAARILTGRIMASGVSPAAIQETALLQKFGIFFTKEQKEEQRTAMRLGYLDGQLRILKSAQNYCGNAGLPAKDALGYVHAELNHPLDINPGEWKSIFQDSPSYGGGLTYLLGAEEQRIGIRDVNWAPDDAAKLFPGDMTPAFYDRYANLSVGYFQPTTLEKADFAANRKERYAVAEEDMFRLRETIAQSPNFVNLLAIQVKLGENERELSPGFLDTDYHRRVIPILSRIAARMPSVPSLRQGPQLLHRLCVDTALVEPEIQALRDSIAARP